jgi:predicted enzyme related to lactoylglutathione lyase
MPDDDVIDRTSYPPGVPCLIDTEQPDPEAATAFYGELFGWTFENMMPPHLEAKYLVARWRDFDVAAIATPTPGVTRAPAWNTYVSVADADAVTSRALALGADVVLAPVDVGPPGRMAGRWAALVDPDGALFRLWQPGYRHGAQVVNVPGTWNSSDLTTRSADRAQAFYGVLFGWVAEPVAFDAGSAEGEPYMWRLPGYGDFLAIRDPNIRRRHADPWVPAGFSDAIGWMAETSAARSSQWTVTFSVADTDAVVARAVSLGGSVVSPPADRGGAVVRIASLRDPQGAEFTVGSYNPTAGRP